MLDRVIGELAAIWTFVHPRIYTYQTLITGIAAVVAAFTTVWQMRSIDAKSGLRHDAIMDLAIRSDRLRLERGIVPMLGRIEACIASWSKLNFDQEPIAVLVQVSDIDTQFGNTALAAQSFTEAKMLFGAAITRSVEDLGRVTFDGPVRAHHIVYLDGQRRSDEDIAVSFAEQEAHLKETVRQRIDLMTTLAEQLRQLALTYGIRV